MDTAELKLRSLDGRTDKGIIHQKNIQHDVVYTTSSVELENRRSLGGLNTTSGVDSEVLPPRQVQTQSW